MRAVGLVASVLLAGAAIGQETPPTPSGEREPMPTVHAFADSTSTRVGARLSVTVEVEEPEGWKVDPPAKDLDLEPFRLRSVERIPRPDGQAFRLVIVPLEAGESEIPALMFSAHGPDGRQEEIATAPIPVTVASNLPPPGEGETGVEAASLKPALSAPRNWIPILVAALILVLAAAGAAYLLRRLRRAERPVESDAAKREPLRPAWETALEELDRIAAANYVGRGELERQYVEVTEALRVYLENRYGVPALESTTSDLNELLQGSPMSGEISSRILSLLREADLVKFAKASPEASQARSTEARARSLVVSTIPPGLAAEGGT